MPVISPLQAIQKAYAALQKGDKRAAHHWAAYAAKSAPGLEEAWLMLAACSSPRASVAYLQRALEINPSSQRARQGLQWARKRLIAEQRARRAACSPVAPIRAPQTRKRPFGWLIGTFLTLAALSVVLAFAVWRPGSARSNAPLPVAAQIWDSSTLMRGEPAPGALPVSAASPATETPLPAPAQQTAAEPIAALETATQAPLPTATLVYEPPTPTPSPIPPTPEPTVQIHLVGPQEDAASIALWYGVELAALLEANGLQSAEQVQPGFELRIPPAEYTAPPPSYADEKLVLVDISEQHLYAYQGDQLVYSFVASTGMGNSTRVGTFEVLNKIPNAYGATWDIWMPSWLGIYWSGHLQNGIHALPILPNGATLWEGYLGTPISYGCVVLGSYEAQLLYDWVEVGTPVKIQW
jgi:lipoprotein-anchoring transpeptidase ErfK/SrfK